MITINTVIDALLNNEKKEEYDPLRDIKHYSKKSKNRKFNFSTSQKFLTLKCPSCSGKFGISAKVENAVSEVLFRYTCPYCGYSESLKK